MVYNNAGYVNWFSDSLHLIALGLGAEVYIIDTLGNRYDKITNTGNFKSAVDISPDGELIVFNELRDSEGINLWIVEIDGTELRQLTFEGGKYPAWSPDGKWIVYTNTKNGNGYLWLITPDGTINKQITFPQISS